MDIKRAKEIAQTDFVWANWSKEQAEAFRILILESEKLNNLKKRMMS